MSSAYRSQAAANTSSFNTRLALTQRFLALHGGTLDFESEPGAGTTVVVTFPKERVLAEAAASEVA